MHVLEEGQDVGSHYSSVVVVDDGNNDDDDDDDGDGDALSHATGNLTPGNATAR